MTWTQRRRFKNRPRPPASSALRAAHPLLSVQLPPHVRGRGPSPATPEHFLLADHLTAWQGNASYDTTRGQRSPWGEQQVGLGWRSWTSTSTRASFSEFCSGCPASLLPALCRVPGRHLRRLEPGILGNTHTSGLHMSPNSRATANGDYVQAGARPPSPQGVCGNPERSREARGAPALLRRIAARRADASCPRTPRPVTAPPPSRVTRAPVPVPSISNCLPPRRHARSSLARKSVVLSL